MIQKTYFITDKLENRFPSQFVCSKNPRYIVVQHCKVLYNGSIASNIELHADFIKRDHYCDYFVMFCNENNLAKYKKYEYTDNSPTFNIWFTKMGETIPLPEKDITFKLQLLLIY